MPVEPSLGRTMIYGEGKHDMDLFDQRSLEVAVDTLFLLDPHVRTHFVQLIVVIANFGQQLRKTQHEWLSP